VKETVSRSTSFGPTASVADTETTLGSAYTFANAGVIKKIRLAFYQGVIDKACTGILYLKFKRLSGPFEFAVGGSMGITTTSGATGPNIPTEEIDVDIPYDNGEQVTVSLKSAEALEECTASITMVE